MKDTQGFMYIVILFFVVFVFIYIDGLHKPPPATAQQLADRLCQELYGPQVGAVWVEDSLKCESVRGEIVEIRNPANH